MQWWQQNLFVFGKKINALDSEFNINNSTKMICMLYDLKKKVPHVARSQFKIFKTLVDGPRELINSLSVEVTKVEVLH